MRFRAHVFKFAVKLNLQIPLQFFKMPYFLDKAKIIKTKAHTCSAQPSFGEISFPFRSRALRSQPLKRQLRPQRNKAAYKKDKPSTKIYISNLRKIPFPPQDSLPCIRNFYQTNSILRLLCLDFPSVCR